VLQEVLQVSLPQAALLVPLSAQHQVERGTAREQPSAQRRAQADVRRRDAASRRERRVRPEVRSVGAVLRARSKARRLAVSLEAAQHLALVQTAEPFARPAEVLVRKVAAVPLSEQRRAAAEVLPSAERVVAAVPLSEQRRAAAEAVQPSAGPAGVEVLPSEARAEEAVRLVAQRAVAAALPSEAQAAAREQPSVARAVPLSAEPSVHSDRLAPLAR